MTRPIASLARMDRICGFRLLDDPKYRDALDHALRRIGYQLGDWQTDERLIKRLDIPIMPLGNARELTLRLTQDAHQDWADGALFDSAAPETELAAFDFNPRRRSAFGGIRCRCSRPGPASPD